MGIGDPISAGNLDRGYPISAGNLDTADPISAGNLDGGILYLQKIYIGGLRGGGIPHLQDT